MRSAKQVISLCQSGFLQETGRKQETFEIGKLEKDLDTGRLFTKGWVEANHNGWHNSPGPWSEESDALGEAVTFS